MAGFYDEMADMATEMLDELKQGTITLSRTVTTGGPVWDPGSGVTTTTIYTLDAVAAAVADSFVDNTLIKKTDIMVTCAAQMTKTEVDGESVTPETVALEIQPGDTVSIDGKGVSIIKTMRVPRAGIAVAWKLIVRS